MRTLVLGGIRSGKSRWAEDAVAGQGPVCYLATGAAAGADPDWAARIARHRDRRPPDWTTVECADVAARLRSHPDTATLVDDIGGWLTAVMDRCDAWTGGSIEPCVAELIDAVREFWQGQASSAAAVQWSGISLSSSRLSIAVRVVADLYAGASNTIGAARKSVLDLVEEATLEHGLTVSDSGAVSAPETKQPWNLADAMQDSENDTAAKVFQQKISTALTALDDEDNRAATALGAAFREIGSLLGNQPDRLDPAGGDRRAALCGHRHREHGAARRADPAPAGRPPGGVRAPAVRGVRRYTIASAFV